MPLSDVLRDLPTDRILRPRDLTLLGLPPQSLGRAVHAGRLVRIGHGAYVPAESWAAASRADRHLMLVDATLPRCLEVVLSHESAAAVWDIPVLGPWPTNVQATGPWRGGGRSSSSLTRHSAEPVADPTERHGYTLTTPARTVVDLGRDRSFATGVVAADHALRAGLCSRDELAREADNVGSRPNGARARAVAAFADPRSESPGESFSRARIAELGLVVPEVQATVTDDGGGFVARVDFWWEDARLVGEFDGRVKYRAGGIADPRAVEERVWDEKVREDRVRATGRGMVRWTWAVARHRTALHELLLRAGVPRATR